MGIIELFVMGWAGLLSGIRIWVNMFGSLF